LESLRSAFFAPFAIFSAWASAPGEQRAQVRIFPADAAREIDDPVADHDAVAGPF